MHNSWSLDLFRIESIQLKTYWILLVMDQCTRRITGFGVQAGVVDAWPFADIYQAIAGQALPVRLRPDYDPLFRFRQWQTNLWILQVAAT